MPMCPLCDRPASTVVHRFNVADIAELFCAEMLSRELYGRMRDTLARLWRQNSVEIRHCRDCDFGFSHPFVAGDPEFYRLQAPDTPYPSDKWEYRRTLGVLRALRPGTSILDVGAGKGSFLKHLLAAGWSPERLQATEFSDAGRSAVEALGVTCHSSDLRTMLSPGRPFDAVCLFQVLEHLDDYDGLLRALDRFVAPGGHLFIAVPNGSRVAFNERAGLQFDCPPNHVSRWTPQSVRVFARKFGWSVEAIELEPSPSVLQEARYGAVNRFLRDIHVPGSWARRSYQAADRWCPRLSRGNRVIKAVAMALSLDAWRAGVRCALAARTGAVPHSLWVHLRRPR